MKAKIYIIRLLLLLISASLFFSACELVDPTEVNNPDITEDKLFEDATGGAEPLLTGLEFAFSDALTRSVVFLEAVSDNYDNTSTYVSTVLDKPRLITPNDQYLGDDREIYFKMQKLRALADFGLSTVLPADANSDNIDKARTLFYKGMAILMLSENFLAFPLEENGFMVRSEEAITSAINSFNEAYDLYPSGDHAINCKLALARAYRLAGNKALAVQNANEALGMNPNYVFYADYDPVSLINRMTLFVLVRSQNDFQPLPRLDFLDPKFPSRDQSDPIPSLKGEEAYLILAEAALSNGDISGAKVNMNSVINLVATRNVEQIVDSDPRDDRPVGNGLAVKADAESLPVAGLINDRAGATVNSYTISGTSLTSAEIDAMTTEEQLWHALYLMRQEVFFSEGRRMSDLGIRLPVMQRQIDANPNIALGDYGTVVYVPAYIPGDDEMDQFSVDEVNDVVTILHDMNKIIAQNIAEVSPF